VRRALVVTQVALSLVLLVGALLFVRSLRNLVHLDAGFRRDHILTVGLNFMRLRIPAERRSMFQRELVERIRAVPGVADAAGARIVPLGGSTWNEEVGIEGSTDSPDSANFNQVGPGYFRTMGTPVLAGRDFDDRDRPGAEPVAIVTESFVLKFVHGGQPVGRTLRVLGMNGDRVDRFRIVGLVRDSKYEELREHFTPIVYLSAAQEANPRNGTNVVVRSELPLSSLLPALTSAIAGMSPEISVTFRPMREILRDSLLRERLMAGLSAFFGFLAALLAMIGLYGVVSYMVIRRRNEIGVRMALGATRKNILALVLREAGTLLAAGLAIGVVLAIGAATLARSLLYGLGPGDPATIVLASVGLAVVAAAASLLPARRAATLDPVAALRED
jgi:predicted permease